MIALVSARGFFVVPDLKKGRLKATKQTPAPHEFFVLMAEWGYRTASKIEA